MDQMKRKRTTFFIKYSTLIPLLVFFFIPFQQSNPQISDINETELSFAVYSKSTFYGLNLDNSAGEIRFRIETNNKHKVLFIDQFFEDAYKTISGFNDQGIFINYINYFSSDKDSGISPSEFLLLFGPILFEDTKLPSNEEIQSSFTSIVINNSNQLFAEENRQGFTIQTINKNSIVQSDQKMFLMINGLQPLSQTENEIYDFSHPNNQKIRVESEILKRISEFSINDGFIVLEQAQPNQNLIASVVIDAENNQIFLCFDKDFEKIWMINLDGETIETYSGFEQYHKGNIPEIGITANDLRILNFSNESLMVRIIFGALGIMLIILTTVVVNFKRKKVDNS